MQCTKPVKVYKGVSKALHENGMLVPCGKCINCRKQKSLEWSIRIWHELSYWEHGVFTTLTYDNEHLPSGGTLVKQDLQDFFKSLRNQKIKLRYFACGEYGSKKFRPHYHAIIFGIPLQMEWLIKKSWKHGTTFNGTVTEESARYVAQYIDKKVVTKKEKQFYDDVGLQVPFQLQSQGIGLKYLNENSKQIINNGGITQHGKKVVLPRYYQKKLDVLSNKKWLKNKYDKSINKLMDKVKKNPKLNSRVAMEIHEQKILKQSEADAQGLMRIKSAQRNRQF